MLKYLQIMKENTESAKGFEGDVKESSVMRYFSAKTSSGS